MTALSFFLASSVLALTLRTQAQHFTPHNDTPPTPHGANCIRFPVVHSTNREVFGDLWEKRGIETLPLANRSDVAYYARLDIGNPPQPNYVQLDTGSFELWVNPDCTNLGTTSDTRFCQAVGSYVPSKSNTANVMQATKTLRYGIGSANIQYVTDDIGFQNSKNALKNVRFGFATETQDEFSGILGIGHGVNVTLGYKNFVDELAAQNVTKTKAFSLALGSKDEQEGMVMFGGLDTAKFAGNLVTLPIVPAAKSPDGVPRYWVDMDYMSLTPPSGKIKKYANTTMAVFLDSGATLTLLPATLADTIAADFGSPGTDANGFYPVDCSLNDMPGTVDFAFPGVTIHVPYNEMIREVSTAFGPLCYLGVSANEDFVLLGDTMLRSAYAVFDQTNNAIHLAQYANCGTEDMEIMPDTDFASIKGKCNAPSFKPAAAPTSSTSQALLPTTMPTGSGSGRSTAVGPPSADSTTPGSAASSTRSGLSWLSISVLSVAMSSLASLL
ncbi:eukaryotic aspartyl protease [Apiospora phragmitis]|uniref:Eukaryotic aspartyl protease n=1 Tax=Apiospora phragmitis TaxID=2905665 RepID=A0ABR1UI33_9PEZI